MWNSGAINGVTSRRAWFGSAVEGLSGVALAWLLARDARASGVVAPSALQSHFTPRAKRVVQVFCAGGVSHVDSFDYKPELERMHGKSLEGKGSENLGFF